MRKPGSESVSAVSFLDSLLDGICQPTTGTSEGHAKQKQPSGLEIQTKYGQLTVNDQSFVLRSNGGKEYRWGTPEDFLLLNVFLDDNEHDRCLSEAVFVTVRDDPEMLAHPVVKQWISKQQVRLHNAERRGVLKTDPAVQRARDELRRISKALIQGPTKAVGRIRNDLRLWSFEQACAQANPYHLSWWPLRNLHTAERTRKYREVFGSSAEAEEWRFYFERFKSDAKKQAQHLAFAVQSRLQEEGVPTDTVTRSRTRKVRKKVTRQP